jgi:hypothetical protein
MHITTVSRAEGAFLLAMVGGVLLWSGIAPTDRLTWFMEVIWVLVGVPLIVSLRGRFDLTRLLLWLVAIHCVILIYGGKYTYAVTPLGDWFRDTFDLSRNHYDRLGHFAQGFMPAILARELLLRLTPLQARRLAVLPGARRGVVLQRLLRADRMVGGADHGAARPTPSSPPRATSGTRSGTCSWPWSDRSWHS